MSNVICNLEPKLVFKYFEEISQIPRGSKDEKAISDYLYNFGKNLGLETIQDDALNIIIKKPATPGMKMPLVLSYKAIWIWFAKKTKELHMTFQKTL